MGIHAIHPTDKGCDLVLMGSDRQINLEVKTRQGLLTSGKKKNEVQFTITKNEKESSQFILAYWFEKSTFFIVPTAELTPTTSNGKRFYKFVARQSTFDDEYTAVCRAYANDWQRILETIKEIA